MAADKSHDMVYRNMGKTGLKWVTFGNQVDVAQAKTILKQCLDNGINFFDNAEVYESGKAEEVMGQAFKELGTPRSAYVLTTKLFWAGSAPNQNGLSRKHIIEGLKAKYPSLEVVYAHRADPSVPMEEVVRAFNYVINQGWALYWGTSEWTAQQIQEAFQVAERLNLIPPSVEQPEYNLFERKKVEKEYLPLYESPQGLGTTTWSPLASGLLTGKYSKDHAPEGSRLALKKFQNMKTRNLVEEKLAKVDEVKKIAEEIGATMPQFALAWTAKNPNVSSVIMGATKEAQIEDNLQSLKFLDKLTPEIMDRVDAIFQNKP